jgi:NAD(P) transhydrogenase subunit alpha
MGHYNLPSRLAADASALYARNLLNFVEPMVDKETQQLAIDWEDEIIAGSCLTRDGKIVHPALLPQDESGDEIAIRSEAAEQEASGESTPPLETSELGQDKPTEEGA